MDAGGNIGHLETQPSLGFPAIHPWKVFDYLIVGAGYARSVLAERLARGMGMLRELQRSHRVLKTVLAC